jgi:hypothetical protein
LLQLPLTQIWRSWQGSKGQVEVIQDGGLVAQDLGRGVGPDDAGRRGRWLGDRHASAWQLRASADIAVRPTRINLTELALTSTAAQGILDELSYFYVPRPFKSPTWQAKKDSKPRAKNSKQIMTAERERAPRRLLENGERGEQFGCTCFERAPASR